MPNINNLNTRVVSKPLSCWPPEVAAHIIKPLRTLTHRRPRQRGRRHPAVWKYRRENASVRDGLKHRPLTPEQVLWVRAEARLDVNPTLIARALRVSRSCVMNILARYTYRDLP